MDQYITKETLDAFGISLEGHDEASLLEHLNDTLKERIGTEIAALLDDARLNELLDLQETASDDQVGDWLAQNVPELPQIVQDEIDILMGELADSTDSINQAAA
ncbi:MAG TPA: DUF5663 domain-containing protein [Candidatus Saccharimonadales bacterium]|nr:DUF5663 domain-containing protein [Candidatus Saccharimonadales bacterium]